MRHAPLLFLTLSFGCSKVSEMSQRWVGWDGGPMMIIGEDDFVSYPGATDDNDRDSVVGAAVDYRRIIEILETRSPCVVDVGAGQALVLESSSEPEATWFPYPDGSGGVVAMLEFADDVDKVPATVLGLGDDSWQDTGLTTTFRGDRQVLVSPALTASALSPDRALVVELPRSTYSVAECYHERDDLGLTLFRVDKRPAATSTGGDGDQRRR